MIEPNSKRDRRLFLQAGALMAASALPGDRARGQQPTAPSDRLSVAIIGVNGRGLAIAKTVLAMGDAEITHVCDVDKEAADRARRLIGEKQATVPESNGDIRSLLELKSIDAVFVATPNHWHAPAAIMACHAGKHVYVEKPCSHNPAEGEWAIEAARTNDRVVQTGTQRRSWGALVEGANKLHQGAIGEILYARCWYNNRRKNIGVGKVSEPPEDLDWDLWQGPAPRRAYHDNLVHYNWHWHWHWGNGELGNNGVHGLDLARWGTRLTYPKRVTASGGKYRHRDSQQTPDTMMVCFDYPNGKTITWEGLSWSPHGTHDSRFGVSFHGTEGTMVMRSTGYSVFDMQDKEQETVKGKADDRAHIENFFDCIRSGKRPNADIQIGHDSALLCHLGNIAYRVQSDLEINPKNGHIVDNDDANAFWQREYEPGWEPLA
ncbi:MAG: Gfo/Idh/MocA family oxidoreductase [Planctomycetota bacterium]